MRGFLKDVLDGKVREVRKWLEKGANVSLYDEYGNTALHLAAEKGFRGVCKLLLDAGADVNQRNVSVGWSAIHYAAYEGHTDVLRMLLAHGAIPNIPDKSGDTPESYAAEWENVECVRILQEATAAKHAADMDEINDMFDSEGSEDSDDDDDDDDESSMMNYIMPPPMAPKTNVAPPTELKANAKSSDSVNISVHLQAPIINNNKNQNQKYVDINGNMENNDSLPDLSEASQTMTGTLRTDDLSETDSEDTLQLIQKSEAIKKKDEASSRPTTGLSIVDKIRNNLQNQPLAPQQNTNAEICLNGHVAQTAAINNGAKTKKLTENVKGNHVSLSSATIPDDLTMSSASVFDTFSSNIEQEKESLVTRLRELMINEESQVDKNLNDCKTRVAQLESEYLKSVSDLKNEAFTEEEALLAVHMNEIKSLRKDGDQQEKRMVIEDSNAKLSELESELQCCSCLKVCCPPGKIYQCPEGDLLCDQCRDTVTICPACNIALNPQLISRNKVLENISMKYFK